MAYSLARSKLLWRKTVSTTAQRPADHGQVAVLPNGTTCSIYSHGSGGTDTVACQVIEVDPANPSVIIKTTSLTLAVPGGSENCQKAWVARLSETEFVATWERHTSGADKIECARIYDAGESWAADQQTAGTAGWVIASDVASGDGDANCRTIYYQDGYFAIRYATETSNSGSAPHVRVYTIRHGLLRWVSTDTTGPVSVGSQAYASQNWDDDDATPTASGGFMLGEMIRLGRGDLLAIWENRVANGGAFNSTLKIRLLSGLHHATPMTEIATGAFKTITASDTLALRRPRLANLHSRIYGSTLTDYYTGGEQVLLTYGQEDVSSDDSGVAKLGLITLNAGAAPSLQDLFWKPNLDALGNAENMGSSCVAVGPGFAFGIAVAKYDGGGGRQFSVQHTDGRHEWIGNGTDWPDRPSVEVWINPNDGEPYVFISSEGYDLTGQSAKLDRILELRKLVKE